jgi:hypothetical protein
MLTGDGGELERVARRNVTLAPRNGTRVRYAPRTVRTPAPLAA